MGKMIYIFLVLKTGQLLVTASFVDKRKIHQLDRNQFFLFVRFIRMMTYQL